jgi:methylated-DNA-[protein]-cysteine S-methyltransferase
MRFSEGCYSILKRVPKGKVTTYGGIARGLKSRGAQAVGGAMSRNKRIGEVPCHRVVRSDGRIGGFALGTKKKIEMLRSEGVEVIHGHVDLIKFGHNI